MDKQLKAENARLHDKIAKLEVTNLSQKNRITALEKQVKELAPPLQSGKPIDLVRALVDSPELRDAVEHELERAKKLAVTTPSKP